MTAASGAIIFDVPVDTSSSTPIFIQKNASRTAVELGEFVDYTIEIKNLLSVAQPNVQVNDTLPPGFMYVKGSARLNGAPIADPTGGKGPHLTFSIGTLAASADVIEFLCRDSGLIQTILHCQGWEPCAVLLAVKTFFFRRSNKLTVFRQRGRGVSVIGVDPQNVQLVSPVYPRLPGSCIGTAFRRPVRGLVRMCGDGFGNASCCNPEFVDLGVHQQPEPQRLEQIKYQPFFSV